jgi:hypothetical protein
MRVLLGSRVTVLLVVYKVGNLDQKSECFDFAEWTEVSSRILEGQGWHAQMLTNSLHAAVAVAYSFLFA